MKKGMTVVLADGKSYILVDSVNYSGEKYFASVSEDETDNNLYFLKVVKNENGDSLEFIGQDSDNKVIEALINHIKETF